jgi:hypothetical protein
MTRATIFFMTMLLLFGPKGKAQTTLAFDTLNYKVSKAKRKVPREIYSTINIESISKIAGRFGFFRKGCTGIGKSKRLNWIASDEKGHYILSISTGGRAFMTTVYYFDSTNNSSKTISINPSNNVLKIIDVIRELHA